MKKLKFVAKKTAWGYNFKYEDDQETHRKKIKPNQEVIVEVNYAAIPRSVKHLRTYWGAIRATVANKEDWEYNTPQKLHHALRIKLDFIETKFVAFDGTLQYIPKSISFAKAEHDESVAYINAALQDMADTLGCTVEQLIEMIGYYPK
jgi:hypothetical protein